MSGGGFRVSIPNSVRKTIQNIKEITGNHSDEEIYAMLKECSLDPNETAQKLLNQDTFHVLTRKHERRKENTGNKEPAEPRWRPNMQGRGGRGGRVNYAPRYVSHDAGGGRNSATGKESMTNQVSEKEVAISPLLTTQESKSKETTPLAGTVTIMADGATAVASGSTSATHASHLRGGIGGNQSERSSTDVYVNKLGSAPPVPPSVNVNKNPTIAFGTGDTQGQPNSSSVDHSASKAAATSCAVCFSSSDPVLVPSHDSRFSGAVGTIKREVGSQRAPEAIVPAENKSTAESESSFMQGKVASKSQTVGKSQLTETSQHSPLATQGGSSVSRPSSNYNIRSQQVIGPQKVGPSKEWKPEPTNSNLAQGSATSGASEVSNISVEAGAAQSQPALGVLDSEKTTSNVQRKLGELHLHDHQHVIIPIHIHVPESERSGLSFGSIDTSFGVSTSYISGPESDKSSTVFSETSPGIEETVEEQPSSRSASLHSPDLARVRRIYFAFAGSSLSSPNLARLRRIKREQPSLKMASDSKNNEKKAVWDSRAHEVWVDCFVDEIDANNRLGTTLSKDGWKNMVTKFNAATGREYNIKQLKNHFDSTKTEWMLWNNLVNKETGLGWDNDKKIIIASDEWWEAKLKKYPNAAKFRGKGLEHCFKLDRIYQDVTATGTRAWAPTSGSVAPFFESYNDVADVERGSDSKEVNPIDNPPLENVTGGSVSVGQSGSGKQGNKGKKIIVATKLGKQIVRICDVAESRKRRDLEGCSKKEVVDRMATLPECELLSELYMFGTKLFMNRDYREMFVALPNDEVRLEWLKREQRDRQA